MSMALHARIPREELEAEKERFDFIQGCLDLVERVDEVHPSRDNDGEYIFLIWKKNQDHEAKLVTRMALNMAASESGWRYEIHSHGCGFIVIHTWI
jgi:hypothetical protein